MVTRLLKRIAARLPESSQHELRRMFFHRQIARRTFLTDEKEFLLLDRFLAPGDWVLDIGANVGHYTLRMSDLVGPSGRVVALEPVPSTFALLASNVRVFPNANVSLLNVAASDRTETLSMDIPRFSEGLRNYYQAHLTADTTGLTILALPVDALALRSRIRLAKIDVEGHELPVLRGMRQLIERDRPVLIVETSAQPAMDLLASLGYSMERLPGSSNLLCHPDRST